MTEKEVLDIIERIVQCIAKQFSFGYYDEEDIKQEGRMYALMALDANRFDNKRGSLYSFLNTHVRNRLLNLRRDKLVRLQPPCNSCSKLERCGAAPELKNNCNKYSNWERANAVKRGLIEAEELVHDAIDNSDQAINTVLKNEVVSLIDRLLPVKYRRDYRKMVEGVKLDARRRYRLMQLLRKIVHVRDI